MMFFAIDLGGTYVKFGVLNQDSEILFKDKAPTPKGSIEELYTLIDRFFEQASKQYQIAGIAISSPGAVTDYGVVKGVSAIPYIHGPNIKEDLEARYILPVVIENDANCAALAEISAGSAKNYKDVLFVVCGTGIGGAVIKNGRLHKGGHQLYAGEFGMVVQYDHDRQNVVSMSELASPGNMVTRVSRAIDEPLTGVDVFRMAEEGNIICQKEVSAFYMHLVTLLTNLQCIYDPQLIVVSGGVTEREQFHSELSDALNKMNRIRKSIAIDTNVVIATFRNDANLMGAVSNMIIKQDM